MANRWQHALADMVSKRKIDVSHCPLKLGICQRVLYLGKTSASRRTTSTPSRTNAEAAYDPAGPPPTTRAVQDAGIDMFASSVKLKLLFVPLTRE